MSADLWRPGPHVYHLGGGELSVGDQQRIPVQHLPPQRGRLWGPHLVSLPHLLVVRHHPQHGGAHLPLRQVSLNASKHLMLTVPLVSQAQNVPAQYTTSDGLGQLFGPRIKLIDNSTFIRLLIIYFEPHAFYIAFSMMW